MGIDVAVECLLFVVYHTRASGVSLMVAGGLRSNGTSCFEREGLASSVGAILHCTCTRVR